MKTDLKNAYKLPPNGEKFSLMDERKQTLSKNATEAELHFKKRLDRLGVGYVFQKAIIKDEQFIIADFYIPMLKLIIEIDGGYHDNKKQKGRDFWKDKYFYDNFYFVLRIKNEDVENFKYYEIVLSILKQKFTPYIEGLILKDHPEKTFPNFRELCVGMPCRKCKTPVVLKKSKKKNYREGQTFAYTHYFYCPSCRAMFMSDKFKFYLNDDEIQGNTQIALPTAK